MLSVLMPAYNSDKYIASAIESILNQTYRDFEFIIIDDGSTDNTFSILSKYNDKRIKIYRNKENIGLIDTLNLGLDLCKGEYIARMDADDISHQNRFEKQVEYLEKNKDCVCVGSWYKILGTNNVAKLCINDQEIRCKLFFESSFGHPTVVFRKNLVNGIKFDKSFPHAEDYKFWVDISNEGKLANIPEVLLEYRIHNQQVSNLYRQEQVESTNKIRIEQLKSLVGEVTKDDIDFHLNLLYENPILDKEKAIEWISLLIHKNIIYDQKLFSSILIRKLLNATVGDNETRLFKLIIKRTIKKVNRLVRNL